MSEIKDTENVTSEVVQEVASEVTAENSPGDHEAQQANILDFDDLHSMYDNRSAKELIDEAKKETAGEEDQSQAKTQSEDKASEASEEAVEKTTEEIKKLFGKFGEEEIEIASNTKFKHIVDGVEGEATLQELINNYSGKVNWDKKYQEMTEYRNEYNEAVRTHKQEVEKLNNYVDTFKEHLQKGDALGALEYFASFSGMKPYEFREELIKSIAPEIERISNLNEDQYRAEQLAAETAYLQKQQESVQAKLKEEQTHRDLLDRINNVRETHSISEEEFKQGYEDLINDSDFSEELSPDVVGQYVLECRAFSKSDELLGKISPELSKNEEILESVQKMVMENPEFADEDYLEIIKEAYNETLKTASASVSKKVEKAPEKQEPKERKKEEYFSFEDLL